MQYSRAGAFGILMVSKKISEKQISRAETTSAGSIQHCAVCRPAAPWAVLSETCCAEHEEIFRVAETIRKGTATGCWEPHGPGQVQERWRNRAERVLSERDYRRHWLHCIVAQDGKCGDPNKDPTGKGCGRSLLALPAGAVHVDHIVPRTQGGGDDWNNCQALCTDCNIAAGDGSREGDPMQAVQRSWEARMSPEVVRQTREQEGKCGRCAKLLWENEPSKVWFIGKERSVICDRCGKDANDKYIRRKQEIETNERKDLEKEVDRYIENHWITMIIMMPFIPIPLLAIIWPFSLMQYIGDSTIAIIVMGLCSIASVAVVIGVLALLYTNMTAPWKKRELERRLKSHDLSG